MTVKDTFVSLSTIKAKKVDWFWRPLIPFGMITIMEGDPGEGKSYLSMYLSALISTGGKLPDGSKVTKGNVLYISSEDDAAYTIRPRIDSMGGNPINIRILNADLAFDDEGLELLRAELDEYEPDIIFIDPVVSFIPEKTDMYRSNSIRGLLGRLSSIAEDYGCAIVLIRHLTKMKHDKAIYQGGGSVDFIAAARSALRVAKHPENENHRVLAHLKHNIGPKGQSWIYELITRGDEVPPSFKWIGPSSLSVEDLSGGGSGDQPKPKDAAEEFLKKELANDPRKAKEMEALAKTLGISGRTLSRARKSLGVVAKQKSFGWVWSLPQK